MELKNIAAPATRDSRDCGRKRYKYIDYSREYSIYNRVNRAVLRRRVEGVAGAGRRTRNPEHMRPYTDKANGQYPSGDKTAHKPTSAN